MNNTSFNNDIHLTYEELVAYSKGNLSNKEMHRLELHLINCQLCNDALDGIANIEEVVLSKNLANIRAETEGKASKSISIAPKQWMAMAAAIALIAVVSVIIVLLPDGQDDLIAEEQLIDKETLAIDDSSSRSKQDEDALHNIAQQEDSLLALVVNPEPQYTGRKVQQDEVIAEEAKGLGVADLPTDNARIAATNDTAFLADNIAVAISENEATAAADKDTAARAKKIAAPVAASATPVTKEAALSVDSKPEENSSYQAAEPEKGIKSYNRYLKRNLKYPDAAKENNISGAVIVQITVNSFGSITNINIVQSLGYGCDQEAIRLIREGPKWLPGKKGDSPVEDRVMVTVPFKL